MTRGSDTSNAVSEGINGLTPEWLNGALSRSGALEGARVAGFSSSPVGTGQVADSFRLTLDYDGTPPGPVASVVVKCASSDERSRQTGRQMGLYEREVRFYADLASSLSISVPRCFSADIADNLTDFVIVMEDLAPARAVDQIAGCGFDDAMEVMVQAGRLHAPYWGSDRLAGLTWLNVSEDYYALQRGLYPDLFAGFEQRYADRVTPAMLAPGRKLAADMSPWYGALNRPATVQHGDFRPDNMLFDACGGDRQLVIVDWQTAMAAPGPVDVSYFLGTSLTIEDRRRYERELVQRYHDELLAAGVRGYSWGQCWDDYRCFSYAGYIMATSASMVVQQSERGDHMFLTMLERAATQLVDHETEALLT